MGGQDLWLTQTEKYLIQLTMVKLCSVTVVPFFKLKVDCPRNTTGYTVTGFDTSYESSVMTLFMA